MNDLDRLLEVERKGLTIPELKQKIEAAVKLQELIREPSSLSIIRERIHLSNTLIENIGDGNDELKMNVTLERNLLEAIIKESEKTDKEKGNGGTK